MTALDTTQRDTLRAFCNTVVPRLERADDPDGFWARTAGDVGADAALEQFIDGMGEEEITGVRGLLDVLAAEGFAALSQLSREQVLRTLSLASTPAAIGIANLSAATLLFAYAMPDPVTGQNPFWKTFGYPGPISPTPQVPKPIQIVADGEAELEADAVVVGSGAGGGVIAAKLAEAGLDVVVLEMGEYHNESDFNQLELWAWQNLYWRGGPTPSADMNITLQAGSCLGGGTVVNWTNSLRTKDWVREQWARDFGLTDVATDSFDRHLDQVWERLLVNGDCSELNPSQTAMRRGAEKLGWSFDIVQRNWDPARHDPATAGYLGFGDQSGAKQSTLKTYLQDAADHGARFLTRAHADRVLTEGGRACGVEVTRRDADGVSHTVTVRAPRVIIAGGALESPALLLRSQIGGPAVGHHLRLHPCSATLGDYGDDNRAWWGAPHAGLINQFANLQDGYGFLIEGAQYTTGLGASAVPFTSALEHKALMHDYRTGGTFIGLIRDHGGGQVVIDANGEPQPLYLMSDPQDLRFTREALRAQIRAHVAGGARRVWVLAEGLPTWRIGDDLETFLGQAERIPPRAGGLRMFSAHQMGTCRMGTDPATSVADPSGELHDVGGVWIGDGSAFPTPSGTNPMITIMALASRTADHILAAAGTGARVNVQEVSA